jgi:hypothetical protein
MEAVSSLAPMLLNALPAQGCRSKQSRINKTPSEHPKSIKLGPAMAIQFPPFSTLLSTIIASISHISPTPSYLASLRSINSIIQSNIKFGGINWVIVAVIDSACFEFRMRQSFPVSTLASPPI